MNQSAILALVIVLSSAIVVSGTDICDNAPCESPINASIGVEFAISLESNPITGFEWWTKFDPNYLSLLNSTFIGGKEIFTLNSKSMGNTEVIMLLLQPWENGAITQRKIFPISIMSTAAAPRQPIALGKGTNPYESLGGMATQTIPGISSSFFKNESVMETPSQVVPQSAPSNYELSSLTKPSF